MAEVLSLVDARQRLTEKAIASKANQPRDSILITLGPDDTISWSLKGSAAESLRTTAKALAEVLNALLEG